METFEEIWNRAAARHGGDQALESSLPQPKSRRELLATGDDRYLAEMRGARTMIHRLPFTVIPFPVVATLLLQACTGQPDSSSSVADGVEIRVATFNVKELSLDKLEETDEEGVGSHPQLLAAAAIVQRVRPDILLLNEIDVDASEPLRAVGLFAQHYLARPAHGEMPITYDHLYAAPSNTGLLSGFDLDDDGLVATDEHRGSREHGNDSWGFGVYPGQYAMAVLSRYPIDEAEARTFQHFRWSDLPGHHMPEGYYDAEERAALRLSSKSHWDLPISTGDVRLHLLASHPTPPGFDGEEDKNGRRNFDEVKFWVHYLEGDEALYDDRGRRGGLAEDAPFVLAGDLNARPGDEQSNYDGRSAISQLLEHPRIRDTGAVCISGGALAGRQPGPPDHPERATAPFSGGIRIDYVLPSRGIEVLGGGVFWPDAEEDVAGNTLADLASDHRLVWVDLRLP